MLLLMLGAPVRHGLKVQGPAQLLVWARPSFVKEFDVGSAVILTFMVLMGQYTVA